jgi:CheY-like chemotaxis protein
LIVDDDADIRAGLGMVLETRGYAWRGAEHGKEALDILSRGLRPSTILLDLMMPVMNGWDFIVALRKDEALADVPVVVLTGYRSMVGSGTLPGSVDVLCKPVDLGRLFAILERYS